MRQKIQEKNDEMHEKIITCTRKIYILVLPNTKKVDETKEKGT